MSDKKSGTAVLEKPSTAIPKINITGEPDKQNDPQIEERQHRVDELIHTMETRMKQASVDFGASKELQEESKELSHDIAGRIRRIGQTAKTDDAFERDVDEAVAAAIRYIINKARKDAKDEKKQEEEKKEKEKEKKRSIIPHEQEKPDVFKKNENLSENVKTKAPETVNKSPEIKNESTAVQTSSINQQKLGSENPLPNKGNKASNKITKPNNTSAQPNKASSQTAKPSTSPQKSNQTISAAQKAIAHQEIVHALQQPQEGRYTTVKKPHDVKLHNKLIQSMESPEDELKRQMQTLSNSLKNRFINGYQKKEEEKKKSASIIPIATLLGQGIKQKFRRTIPQIRSEEELIETTSGDEVLDRGSAAVGNPYSQNVTINRGTPKNTGEESYSKRDSGNGNANNQQAAAAAQGGGGGGRRNRKKKKIRERIEEKYGKKVLRELLLTVVKSPWFWLALGIIYLVLFIISIFGGAQEDQTDGAAPSLLSITKTGPANAIVGQDLVYTITADYKGKADDLTIVDQFPEGVTYVSSAPAGVYDAAAKTVTWNAKTLGVTLANPTNWSVKVTLRATLNNIKVVNKATASVVGTAGGAGYVPPTATDCGNAGYKSYMAKTPLKLNFGDPNCNFSKDELYTQLKAADPTRADIWFNKVIPCESGYNPNAYAGPQTGTPDARGAWGLYQMGSSNPAGSAPPAPGKNGPNDRGDVPWSIQTINATTYAQRLSSLGQYWACARNVKYQ